MSNPALNETHDPARTSWVESANGHRDFPIQNLPFGIFDAGDADRRPATAIGAYILDLRQVAQAGLLPPDAAACLQGDCLNELMALPPLTHRQLRARLSELLHDRQYQAAVEPMLITANTCTLHVPARIGDYTDFYVGIHHANNIGRQYRPDNPLLPNYKHIPIGYHGRASSIRPSGTPVIRPSGQTKAPDAAAPSFGPSRRLDYELEIGVWIGRGNALGDVIPISQAPDHIFGFCLLNDWSARDIQGWEAQPLGPFLAKSFQSSISPWIVTAEALAPFRTAQPARPEGDPRPLPYLWNERDQAGGALGVRLLVHLLTAKMQAAGLDPVRISDGQATNMYWTVAQLVAHHSSNGCNLNPGDLLGTGTISSVSRDGFGSLMEISAGGTDPLTLPNGETRTFLEDGDTLILSASAEAAGAVPIGFGHCSGVVLPAK